VTLAERIRTARKERQLSQEALANRAGMSLRAFRSLETGEADDPHYSTLSKLAEALGLSVSELVGEKSLVPLSEAPEGEAGPPAQVDRLQVLNDYAESFSSIAEKKRRELEILEEKGQEKPLEVLALEALAAYLGVKGFVKEAEAMQPQQGESVSESRARRRVLDAVDELFEIARLKVPAAIKRLSSGEPQRENATVTSLYDYQRRHAG
jgi:transcriptional regulator with XRE-family HTH domain